MSSAPGVRKVVVWMVTVAPSVEMAALGVRLVVLPILMWCKVSCWSDAVVSM